MRRAIDFAEAANEDLDRYRAYDRIAILDVIEKRLRHEPTREGKSRIKALRGLSHSPISYVRHLPDEGCNRYTKRGTTSRWSLSFIPLRSFLKTQLCVRRTRNSAAHYASTRRIPFCESQNLVLAGRRK